LSLTVIMFALLVPPRLWSLISLPCT
jgi:hypothetical protein